MMNIGVETAVSLVCVHFYTGIPGYNGMYSWVAFTLSSLHTKSLTKGLRYKQETGYAYNGSYL